MLMILPRVCRVFPIAGNSHRGASRNRSQQSVRLVFVAGTLRCLTHLKKPSSRLADLTDADFFLEPLDSSLFPGIPSDVEAHSGFANDQARYATLVTLKNVLPHAEKFF